MTVLVSFSPVPAPLLSQWLVAQSGHTHLKVVSADETQGPRWDESLAAATVALGDYTFRQSIDETLLERMPRLTFVQQPSVGYQHIDLQACRRRGVRVSNTPGVNSSAVAEHTLMVALALLRRLVSANELTHAGRWAQHELMWEQGIHELAGKTWGIVGLGSVGRELARRLIPFKVQLLYFDVIRTASTTEAELGTTYKPLEHLLRLSDVVSLHVPLTSETRNLIGERQLGLMKFSAVLINVARGECVDEAALATRIQAKKLAGAACDVFSREPIAEDHPLLGIENVLLTPHLAGATNEVRQRVVQAAIANLVRVLRGEEPQFVVKPTDATARQSEAE